MKKPVRILIVEDISEDVDLAKNEICKIVGECEFQVVETYEGFLRAVETFEPDVIISDYTLPRFDGLKALALTQKHAPLTPFIIWTGSISENLAVECVRAGANNYIFKDDLKRLGPAVARALEEKELMAEHRQAEEALQNNEKRFRALIENGLDDISLLAADGSLLWESPSTVRNLGYQPNEFVGRNIFDLMHPDDLKWIRNTYVGLLQSPGARQRGTFRLRRSDGTWRWVEAIATNMLDDASVKAIVVNYRDITEQKQTEIELQQKNADLALINALNELINRGEALDAVMNRLREETKRIFSTEYTNIYLLNEDGQSLKTDQYSLPPHVREKIERLVGRAIPVIDVSFQPDSLFQSVLRSGHGMVTSDSKVIQNWMGEFVETSALPPIARTAIRKLIPQIHKILNIKSIILVPLISDGKPLGVLNISSSNILMEQDLKRVENIGGQLTTALYRRQVEELLKEERNLLRTLIDNLPDLIYAMDIQGRKTLSNTADWQASGGKTMADVIGKTDFELYPPEMANEFWKLGKAVLESGKPVVNYEEPGLDADGNRVSILTSKIPLRDEAGKVVGLVGIGRDITERKQIEERINDLLAFNEKILNNSPMGILTYKFTGECVFANENAAVIAGANVEQLKALNFHTLESWKKSGFYDLVQKAITTLSPVTADIHHISIFGKEAWITVHCTTFKLKAEDHLLIFLTDITERKHMEEKLLSSQRDLTEAQRVAKMGNWSWDIETNTVHWSDEAYQVFGIDRETFTITHDNFIELVHPEDRALVKETTLEVLNDGKSFNVEYRIVAPTDEVKVVSEIGYAVKDDSGTVVSIFGLSQDITERKRAESERQALLEIMQGLANTKDLQELLNLVHRSIAKVIYAKNFFVVLHQENTGLFEEIYSVDQYDPPEPPSRLEHSITSYVFRSGKPLLLTQDLFDELETQGEVKLVGTNSASWLGVPLKTSGRTIGVMAVQDYENKNRYSDREKDFLSSIATQVALVIERKRAEEALRESEEHYRTIFEGVQDAIFVESLNGKIMMVNERACEMFGYSQAEFLTKTVAELVPAGHSILMAGGTEELLSAEPRETINQRANGEVFPIEISGRVQVINGQKVLLVVVRDITERKHAEEALRNSESKYRTLAENSLQGIAIYQGQKIVYANPAMCRINGYTAKELFDMSADQILALTHPDDRAITQGRAIKRMTGEILHPDFEGRILKKDGTTVWLQSFNSPIDYDGKPALLSTMIDITERKRAEAAEREQRVLAEALRDTAETLSRTLDYGEVLDHILTAVGRVVPHDAASILLIEEGSARVVRSQGYDKHNYDPKIMGVKLPLAETTNLRQMLETRQPVVVYDTYSYTGWKRMPATDWLRSSVGAPISIYGEIIGFICLDSQTPEYFTPVHAERLEAFANQAAIAMYNARLLQQAQEEIAERRKVETALLESNTRFHTLFEASPDAIVLIDPNDGWSIVDCNTAACQMNGYGREEMIGQCIDMLNTAPAKPNERAEYMESIQQHRILHYETSHRRKDGTIFDVEVSTSLIKVGTHQLVLGIDRDITERKKVETALLESNTRFRTLFEASPDAIVLIDPRENWSIIDCNSAACEMNGYAREELLGQCVDMLNVLPFDPDEKSGYLESIRQYGVLRFETSHRRKDGSEFTVDVSTSLIKFDTRDLILGIDRDITERKRAEAEIHRQAEETSALLQTSLALTNLDLEATLQTIGNSANTLFLADGCRVFLTEPDGETLRCVLALGENTDSFLGLRVKIGEGVTGAVAAHGMAEIVNEMQNDPRAVQVPGTDEEQEAIMFAPLKERERTIGILSVRRIGQDRRFQQADLELLEAFASMAASAVSNARLFEETQSHLAELRASEERFRQLADNIQEAFWMTDAETGREIYMSPAIETIWGRSVQNMMEPDAYINNIFPEDQSVVLDAIEKEKRGEKMQTEYRIVRPDGSLRWIWDRAFPVSDAAGKVIRIAGISADITERKDAAEKLRESEDRYHSLFQNQLHGSALHEIVTDDQGQPVDYIFLKVNPAFEKMTGVKAQDIVGRHVTDVLPGIENERLIQIYGQVALTGEPAHLNEYFAPLGKYYEINAYATGPRRFAVSFVDVTERRQAEQELRKLSRAVEQSSSTIVITDTSGNIEYVNPKFTEITGYSFEEVVGRNPRVLKSGFTAEEEYTRLWKTIIGGEEWHGELLNKKKDGTLYWESVTISPIMDDRREITHFVGVKEDITERKQSEIEIRRHIAELEAVYENGLSVGRLLEPGEIGNRVIETFSRYLPWHHVTIRLRKEESDDLELVAFSLPHLKEEERANAEQHFVARINKVGQGLSGWVIQTGTPLRTGNVHAHPQYIDTHAGVQSGLYMPLKVGERVIGVISVESEAPNAFTEQDERLLATLANQTAVSFENARLYEVMQKELSERKRAEDALRVSETHYRALADSITDILFEMDQDLHYTHWNKASETLIGIPASDVIGKSMEDIQGRNEEQVRIKVIYEDVLRNHQPRTFETALALTGEKRSFEVTAYPSMRGVSVVAKDVTDRKRTESIMQKRFELMEYSARHSLKDLMQKTVDEVSELTGSTIGFFHFMEEDQIHLGMQRWSTNALQLFQVASEDGAHRSLDQAGVWAEAVRQRRPLIQNDYESLSKKKGVPQGHVPILREMVIPIIRNEGIMAVMGIGNKPQDYTPHDLEIAARLADYAWDITERKQMEVALEIERNQLVERVEERTADLSRANSNLARALRVKDEFLANMSHELRTPLNAILGLSESLGEQIAGPLNEKQQKYISTISESGHHLLSLINDILDLAKIDAGHITLDINKVDIRSVCQASLRMIKQLAQKKNQEVSLEIDDGLGLMWADERRLKQMIVNLLGNAVKFTPENGKLGLKVNGDREANQIGITVWDNGIGIKDGDLERLFQPFVQLDSGLAREATGTGLGLALVAQMARLHGGSVSTVSEAGRGSRFTILLPWEPALAMDAAARMKITGKFRAIQLDDRSKPTILLVEDTQEVVMMLKDYLELTGYKVFTAQDGIDGIVQARHVKPDLILMDVQMPRMNGFEATRKLRSDPNFRYTPIIALTALAMPHDRERCLEAGMDEYISKPVNLKALVKIIQSCLFEQGTRTR